MPAYCCVPFGLVELICPLFPFCPALAFADEAAPLADGAVGAPPVCDAPFPFVVDAAVGEPAAADAWVTIYPPLTAPEAAALALFS